MSTHCLHKIGHRGDAVGVACCKCGLMARVHEKPHTEDARAREERGEAECEKDTHQHVRAAFNNDRASVEWWKFQDDSDLDALAAEECSSAPRLAPTASELDELRAEVERLRSIVDGASPAAPSP